MINPLIETETFPSEIQAYLKNAEITVIKEKVRYIRGDLWSIKL